MKKFVCVWLVLFCLNVYANGCGGEFQAATGTCRIIGSDGRQILYNSAPPQPSSPPQKIIRYTTVNVPSKYGALAFNKKEGISGGFINADSLQQAKELAIKRCQNGNSKARCEIIAWVRNGCIAGAVNSRKQLFKAVAESSERAEQAALNRCEASGSSGCQIAVPAGCSIP